MPLKYQDYLKPYSRALRNNSTLGEILLWNELKQKKLGYQFYRQKPISNYIADFYCPALKLIIEIDGKYHSEEDACLKDVSKQEKLEGLGLNVLRFNEQDVRKRRGWVIECIEEYVEEFAKIVSGNCGEIPLQVTFRCYPLSPPFSKGRAVALNNIF